MQHYVVCSVFLLLFFVLSCVLFRVVLCCLFVCLLACLFVCVFVCLSHAHVCACGCGCFLSVVRQVGPSILLLCFVSRGVSASCSSWCMARSLVPV